MKNGEGDVNQRLETEDCRDLSCLPCCAFMSPEDLVTLSRLQSLFISSVTLKGKALHNTMGHTHIHLLPYLRKERAAPPHGIVLTWAEV